MNSYITGKSLICNLGDTNTEIISKLKNMSQETYEDNLKNILKEKAFYKIYDYDFSNEQRYKNVLKKVVLNAINEAKLTKEEQKDLHIFIGSTSMEMGTNEEYQRNFIEGKSSLEFKDIGNGSIGEYIETIIDSNHKSILISTACTSSINALAYASKMIEQKQIKKALVLGVEFFNKSTFGGFSSLMLLSQNKIYRPFDKNSDGIILGEGCSAVVLEDEKKKENDFKYISSSNLCDNFSETTSDPSGIPIFKTMDESLKNANMTIDDIDCIKAHATGSENNNSSEAKALKLLFDKYNSKTQVTALKPVIGHTLGACGTNEIILMLNAIEEGFIPATYGFKEPAIDVRFTPVIENKPCSKTQTILFNYVAFGGNNSSIILSNKA